MILSGTRRVVGRAGRSSVLVIAILLLSSATIRLVVSAGSAIAQDSQHPNSLPTEEAQKRTAAASVTPQESQISATTDRTGLSALISALKERETLVVEREKQLELRLRALSVAEAEIEKRLFTLTETEESLRATLSLADEASEKDILRLTSVYETMKPKDAAALFEQMEPNFAAGFLGRMRPDTAAAIFAGLSPEVAYSISVILAGRNANAPKT